MALQIIFTDGTGAQGLQAVFGAFINTAVADTYNDRVLAQQAAAAASASQLAAANSASAASTSATNASNSATASASSASSASTSATNASNSASAAATSETNAANSATSAANSASSASTSATNAANSATSAANSASQAAATLANALTKANNLSDVASASTSRTNLGLGSLATQNASAVAITGGSISGLSPALPVASGGTGAATLTAHGVLIGEGTGAIIATATGTAGQALLSGGSSADPAYGNLAVSAGGTGRTTLTANSVLLGEGTAGLNFATTGTAGRVLVDNGAGIDPSFKSIGVLSGRNAIINGKFDIWQRGTSLAADSANNVRYIADRWYTLANGSSITPSQQAFTLGQGIVPLEPSFFHRSVVSTVAGAGNFATMGQAIESVRTFAGQTVTVSFWAKADASKNIAIEFIQDFGTGGSPSSAVQAIGSQKFALTTSWQQYSASIAIPSISGKTIGSNGNDALRFRYWFDAGSTYNTNSATLGQQSGTFDISEVQIEAGSVATTFEQRLIETELALCQRYFAMTYNYGTAPGTALTDSTALAVYQGPTAESNSFNGSMWYFPVGMRAAPTATIYNPHTGATGTAYTQNGATSIAAVGNRITTGAIHLQLNNVAVAAADFILFHASVSAEL